MTLPSSYNTSKEYVIDSLNFLKSYHWFFNYNNTHILVNKVLSNFPVEWLPFFKSLSNEELNSFPVGNAKKNCPSSLKDVLNKIESLKPNTTAYSQECHYNFSHNSGLSRKKLHEIVSLAPLIDKVCKENDANFIIDIGAGLGYLSHLLNDNYKYSVLGIECSSEYINQAYRNQKKFYPNSEGHVKFTQHYVDENSSDQIKLLTEKCFPEIPARSACIVGLHACADLSITILDLFAKLEFVKCLVIMPCCYHRIKLDKTIAETEFFTNFPASKLFKAAFEQVEAEKFIRRPFLRLACQQTMNNFISLSKEEHERHSRSCMYRAILQEVVELENCRVERLRRKSGKSQTLNAEEDFHAYLSNLKNTHRLAYDALATEKLEVDDERFIKKMHEKWNEHKEDCYLVEVLTGFQASIQSICENLILLDRVECLKEKGFQCFVQKVTNDRISPRCYALIALKQQ